MEFYSWGVSTRETPGAHVLKIQEKTNSFVILCRYSYCCLWLILFWHKHCYSSLRGADSSKTKPFSWQWTVWRSLNDSQWAVKALSWNEKRPWPGGSDGLSGMHCGVRAFGIRQRWTYRRHSRWWDPSCQPGKTLRVRHGICSGPDASGSNHPSGHP